MRGRFSGIAVGAVPATASIRSRSNSTRAWMSATRIARDLHDTLLQSFHGLMFRFQAARNMLPRRPEEAMQALDGALERTEQAIAEGRDAIQGLRASTVVTNDLAQAVTALGAEMSASQIRPRIPQGSTWWWRARHTTCIRSCGTRSTRLPARRYEMLSATHRRTRSRWKSRYNGSSFQLRVRDDGKGIDPAIAAAGRAGHYGVPGMRERAKRIGGKLDVWTGTGAGTEVELSIPGSIAYGTFPGPHRFRAIP